MKRFTILAWLCIFIYLVGCTTVSRPDLPVQKGYEAKQSRVLGFIPLFPRYEKVETKAEETRDTLRKPAVLTLSICLPIALIAFAASLVLQNPSLGRKLVSVALIAFLAAFGAAIWLLMTMWLIGFAVIAVVGGAWVYFKMHGKGFKWQKGSDDV